MPKPLSDEDVECIRAAILAGRKIEAIKLYRQASGEGLHEAKVFIEAVQERMAGGEPMSRSLSNENLDRIRAAIFAGEKISAIKLYRQATGEGLLEAKQFVERIEAELRQTEPEKFTAPPAKGCGVTVICLLLLLALVIAAGT